MERKRGARNKIKTLKGVGGKVRNPKIVLKWQKNILFKREHEVIKNMFGSYRACIPFPHTLYTFCVNAHKDR